MKHHNNKEDKQRLMLRIPHTHYFMRKAVSQRGYVYYCAACGLKAISKAYAQPMIVKKWEEI